jgi:hypothetical protein
MPLRNKPCLAGASHTERHQDTPRRTRPSQQPALTAMPHRAGPDLIPLAPVLDWPGRPNHSRRCVTRPPRLTTSFPADVCPARAVPGLDRPAQPGRVPSCHARAEPFYIAPCPAKTGPTPPRPPRRTSPNPVSRYRSPPTMPRHGPTCPCLPKPSSTNRRAMPQCAGPKQALPNRPSRTKPNQTRRRRYLPNPAWTADRPACSTCLAKPCQTAPPATATDPCRTRPVPPCLTAPRLAISGSNTPCRNRPVRLTGTVHRPPHAFMPKLI